MRKNEISTAVESLQNLLVSRATGSVEDDAEFLRLRKLVLDQHELDGCTPKFLRTCRNLAQFWQFIKFEYASYAERRQYLWDQFRPMLEFLERGGSSPSDGLVSRVIEEFDLAHVQAAWKKALDRKATDPEGAITMARTLLESVCKHILEDGGVQDDSPDLNKLYRQTAEKLNLAPSQHTEQVFKQILGGCTAVVEGLGALRNRLSDSHGKGKVGVKPASRHAELAVNLSGTLAVFLLSTWDARNETSTN